MDSGKPNKSVKDSTSKDRRQKPKASASEISANVDAMLAAEIDKLANVSTKAKSIVSNSSCKSALSLKLQMQKVLAEETLMLEEMKRRREFMKKKFELMEEIAEVQSCPVPGARTTDPLTKVKGWLQKQRQAENESVAADDDEHDSDDDTEDNMDDDEDDDAGDTESSSEYAADEEGDNSSGETEPESVDSEDGSSSADESYHERGDEHHEERFSPRERSTPVQVRASRTSNRVKHSRSSATLSRDQIAARQVVPCDLPKFGGSPEEWPMFISTFESTTRMCGYKDEENMIRLRNCLKDEAFASVRSFLMHPSMVSKAISVLKLRFGQPHMIISTLREKVLATPPIRTDSIEKLVDYALAVQNLCSTIDACGRKEYMRDATLMQELVCKLPSAIKLDWARHSKTLAKVTLSTFSDWIFSIAEDASIVANLRKSHSYEQEPRNKRQGKVFVNTHVESSPSVAGGQKVTGNRPNVVSSGKTSMEGPTICPTCKGSCRTAAKCKRFLDLSYEAKWAAVRELRICRRCLRQHGGNCNSKPCGVNGCTFKHNSLLHKSLVAPGEVTGSPGSPNPAKANEERSINTHRVETGLELFRYIPVTLFGPTKQVECYAFLDDGSELTLLDEQIAKDLDLIGGAKPLCLKWTGGTHRFEEKSRCVDIGISGSAGRRFELSGVRTVEALELPYQSLNVEVLQEKYKHLRSIPVESYNRVQPRILIGVKHANVSLVRRCREGKEGEPIAVKTHLGWTIFGGWSKQESSNGGSHIYHICACNLQNDEQLHLTVKQYFSLDSLGIMMPVAASVSKDDERALMLLSSLTQVTGNRYQTGLLWRFDNIRLPDSRPMALQRLKCLERRLAKNADLKLAYDGKLAEYETKGYIRKVTQKEIEQNKGHSWYLPTFPVINPNKPGKIRIVWDAAATAHGVSLNSMLLTGPDLLSSLVAVLNQFRENRIGICGDIREMFLQIGIRREDQFYQLFLWNDNVNQEEPSTYVVPVMIFGARSSPTTAQFVKNQNAQRFRAEFPVAVEVIEKKHYVDDMLASTETEDEAIDLAKSVKHVHAQGGFDIRNWVSNSAKVLNALNESPTSEKSLNIAADIATEKVLGMWWNTSTDCFTFKICWTRFDAVLFDGSRAPTKRELLRILMSIFDPLGLISQFLMILKVTLQEVWRKGLKWDDQIEGKQLDDWQTWTKLLPKLEELQIPRCYRQITTTGAQIQMHTFVDAGDKGMAAVVYLRFEENGVIECALVGAKTRVAPLKYLSTPRSELQAAVIGARLSNSTMKSLSLSVSQRFFWCDSRNVLCWLRSDHRRYSQYVAARTSEILDTTEVNEWNWIKSEWNVADDGTKWTGQVQMKSNDRWFLGPAFLQKAERDWPVIPYNQETTTEELRTSVLVHRKVRDPVVVASDYSSWNRLLKVTAYVQRFVYNLQAKRQGLVSHQGPLSSEELRQAQLYHFRQAQQEVYHEEMLVLKEGSKNGENVRKQWQQYSRSQIYKMSPFVDEDGVLRMNSRAAKCSFLFPDEKFPIILPDNHPVTKILLVDFHERYHHRNYATVANEVRRRYCIPRLRQTLRKMRCGCQWCRNRDAKPAPPEMAELPSARMAAFTRPFSHVGVDFFGPIEVLVGRRVEKRWGVLLTCLTVRALHIEVANSLSTSSCMMALNNFIARRGTPVCFYSDRGTNFVGASKELRDALKAIDKHEMSKEFTTPATSWQFNPPSSPHMGGSWERLIQSVKRNLTEVLKCRRSTDEELRSALTQIESVLNSRPLTDVPVDNESEPALTPNHFLLGSSDGSKPLTLFDDSVQAVRRGWQVSQMMANLFWRRWLRNYLPEITKRTKWFKQVKPIAVGDIVVIVDPELPRNCWPKGRVIGTVEKGSQVRRATVQTSKGVYERPAVKLAVLDIWSENR
ncbi:uncharacterized protein LOC134286358 [Aedes albopictus]|uniref:Integrase catalytic domain-containing protein n=1 Tax=Aedes albopictus TaxID=7160 RepID=A0ABM1ZD07_AEDAL